MKSPKIDFLIGKWEPSDENSTVVVEISKTGGRLKVRAFDKNDHEDFIVSKTKWDGKALNFETTVLSNKWRTRNKFTPISRNKVIQELTFWENWKKVAPIDFDGLHLLQRLDS